MGLIDGLVEAEVAVALLWYQSATFLGLLDEAGYLGDVLLAHSERAAPLRDLCHRDSLPAGTHVHQVGLELGHFVPLEMVVVSACHLCEVLEDLGDTVRQVIVHDVIL